jgi:hypothetical protein
MLSTNHRSSKVTHGGRKAGAQHAHASGASIEDIAHHGNWNYRRLVTHYLTQVSKEVPYKMAGFTLPNEEFWLERNTLIPPKELQKMLFPFIEDLFPGNQDWARWIENVMEDNPEDLNRPQTSRVEYAGEYYPAMRLVLTLAHLRKVILQDAVVLLSITEDSLCMYGQHDIFTIPAFSSPMFREYSSQLHDSMRNAESPLADSLTANASAIHNKFRSVKSALGSLETCVQQRIDGLESDVSDVKRDVQGVGQGIVSLTRMVSNAFTSVGQFGQLLGETVAQVEHQQQVQQRRQRPHQHTRPQQRPGDPRPVSNEDAEE